MSYFFHHGDGDDCGCDDGSCAPEGGAPAEAAPEGDAPAEAAPEAEGSEEEPEGGAM